MPRRRDAGLQFACIHGNGWSSAWAAEECDCMDPETSRTQLV